MDERVSQEQPVTTPHKLRYKWLTPAQVAHFEEVQSLREGHPFLSIDQFNRALALGWMEVLAIEGRGAVLVEFGVCADGKFMNILTVSTHADNDPVGSLQCIEQAARDRKQNLLISIGRPGWKNVVKACGFETKPLLRMEKKLI